MLIEESHGDSSDCVRQTHESRGSSSVNFSSIQAPSNLKDILLTN